MVFLWQSYFIELTDFSLFCLSFKSHAEVVVFILPKNMSLEKKNIKFEEIWYNLNIIFVKGKVLQDN